MVPWRFGVALAALVFLGIEAADAVWLGEADSIVYRASVEMNSWANSGAPPGVQTWEWVHDDLVRAAKRNPASPNVHDMIGVLAAQRVGERDFLPEALNEFRLAAELRPTSPYTWANIARVQYLEGDTGAEFEAALIAASKLGPSEREVQLIVADYGLAVWDQLSLRARQAVASAVSNGIQRNANEMLQIAERRGRLATACGWLTRWPRTLELKWSKSCQGKEATQ
jgi:hypothetical protein